MKMFIAALCLYVPVLCIGQSGPAGIGKTDGTSSLIYWVDASQGVTGTSPITAWSDLSGHNVTNTIVGAPQWIAAALNGRPVIRFAGPDLVNTNLSINSSTYPNLTIIAVYSPLIANSGGVWGEDNGGWDRFLLDASGLPSLVSNGSGPTSNIPGIYPVGGSVITSIIYQVGVANGTTVNANGTTEATITTPNNPQSSNNLGLASIGDGSANYHFHGDIAELMIFGTNLNAAERIIIDNYLSAKYGIPLSTGTVYTQGAVANGGYAFDVAGIGRIDASNMSTDAKGTGMVEILNPSTLTDNEFLFWGNDGAAATANNTTDVPAGIQARFARVWRVSERNAANTADVDVGNVDMRFDLTGLGTVNASDLRLLIDANNNGLFNDDAAISGATSVGGNVYQFSAVPGTTLTNNSRFTIGTINSATTPLPIRLLFFAAEAGNGSVMLRWATASESNSDYFEVQRSADGTGWQSLSKVKAAGNSNGVINYHATDPIPGVAGDLYYRLKQVDLDGRATYSEIQKVNAGNRRVLQVFPSPAKNILYVQTAGPGEKITGLYSITGQNVLAGSSLIALGNDFYSIDITGLPKGTYIVKTNQASVQVIKN
ncbi:MAG: T9SS type A sorting domain-containing protein [Bacteroidota bacterium]|nr:T9SS type A sorting domain-containing protein [Bacteroidota bacterium]MDP4254233.1 T9SS type A sorting domain-containing protein [Bacteroidota bacterium]MDP4260076.1 T9SS type A sorting domain-containing protein [Bacteroidota bacterium]